jgi:CheY-like chemotaxis protein
VLRVVTSMNSAVIRELRSPAFQAIGVAERVVTSGAAALAALRSEHPALVILDADLPDQPGDEVCAAIKRQVPGVKVILVASGPPTAAQSRRWSSAGCDYVLVTPLRDGDVHAIVARLFDLPPGKGDGLWEISERPTGLQVALRGEITERTDFTPLLEKLPRGEVSLAFQMSGVRYMNSVGLKRWLDFLGALDPQAAYSFQRCSVMFVTQVGLVPLAAGRGPIKSFLAPYRCDGCDRETEELLTAETLGQSLRAPSFACGQCGGTLVFDDIPDRYFAFMQS